MSRSDRALRGVLLFGLLSLAMVAFIWGNSMLDRAESGAQSGFLAGILKPILDPMNRLDADMFHRWLRKAAHFAEFAFAGFLISGFTSYLGKIYGRRYFALPLLLTLVVAVLDEYIQQFTGRGSSVADVVLDYSGAVVALAFVWILSLIRRKNY